MKTKRSLPASGKVEVDELVVEVDEVVVDEVVLVEVLNVVVEKAAVVEAPGCVGGGCCGAPTMRKTNTSIARTATPATANTVLFSICFFF